MGDRYHNQENIRIGLIVKDFREAMGFSRSELGRLTGYSYELIGAVERGKRNCTVTARRKIVDALGVPLAIFTDASVREERMSLLRNGVRPVETSAA